MNALLSFRTRYSAIFGWVMALGLFAPSWGKTYYAAPNGNDVGSGSTAQPWKDLKKALAQLTAGDTLLLQDGIYACSLSLPLSQSGKKGARIVFAAAPGATPILDFSTQPYGAANRGLLLTGSYWHLFGLEITRAGDNGLKIEGNHNRIERCVFHHNGDSGVQLGFAHETENPDGTLCAYNEIIDSDSYLNFDFDNRGSDADGFACKMHNGKGNVFRGCRAWRNSDDGWDLYETDWPVEISDCWTWMNGDQTDFDAIYLEKMGKSMSSFQGNGNGFKLGGNGTGGNSKGTHVVKRCIAFGNNFRSKKGFDQNSHQGGVTISHCLAFGNGYNFMFEDSPASGFKNRFIHNVSFDKKASLDHEFAEGSELLNNSWDLPLTVTAADFNDLSEAAAKASRGKDGSLPAGFARLVAGSDLIDQGSLSGAEPGAAFAGKAPDLGPFEWGNPTTLMDGRSGHSFGRLRTTLHVLRPGLARSPSDRRGHSLLGRLIDPNAPVIRTSP